MRRVYVLLSLAGSLLVSACGPAAGDECRGGGYLCSGPKEALECREGRWRALPCRGAQGCSQSQGSIRCDMSANMEEDACALSAEGRGLCTADGKGVLECRQGALVKTRTCASCTMSGNTVACQP